MAGEAEQGQQALDLWNDVAKEREGEAADDAPLTAAPDAEEPKAEQHEAVETAGEIKPDDKPAEPDPYEGLHPALKARLEKLESLEQQASQIAQLQQTVKTAEGRVAAMQREMDQAKSAAKATGNAPSNAQIQAAKGDLTKWEALKGDFPEWADATEQFVKASLAGIAPSGGVDPEQVDLLIEQRIAAVRAESKRAIEEAKVEGKHPNWRDEINTDAFRAWHDAQSPEVQALAKSEAGRDAIRLLDLFAEAKAKPAAQVQQERAAKLAAAASNKPNGAASPVAKRVEDMTPAELWEYERKRNAKKGADRGLAY